MSSSSTFTGSTTPVYTLELTGSGYNGNCPLCGHLLYGTQQYGSGSNWYIECGWCHRVFRSGSSLDVTTDFRGYIQGASAVKYMMFSNDRDWAP